MNFDLNRIWDQIYEAGNRPVEQRSELLDSLLAHLEIEAHVHPSADVYYAIGYLCYVHPDKSERMQAKLLASLSKSIELKPTFASPKLQLGHYYYDLADYRTAISYFREAARADWSEYYALWLQEMTAVRRIRRSISRKAHCLLAWHTEKSGLGKSRGRAGGAGGACDAADRFLRTCWPASGPIRSSSLANSNGGARVRPICHFGTG